MARPISDKTFPGVTSKTTASGKTLYRFRMGGIDRTLKGEYGSDLFKASYDAALSELEGKAAAVEKTDAVIISMPGKGPMTFAEAYRVLLESHFWATEIPTEVTRDPYRRKIEAFLKTESGMIGKENTPWANIPFIEAKPRLIQNYLNDIERTQKASARIAYKALVAMTKPLLADGWIEPEQNIMAFVKIKKPSSRAHSLKNRPWPQTMQDLFEAKHPLGTPARTAYVLARWLGCRLQDVIRMRWDHLVEEKYVKDGRPASRWVFKFNQQKFELRTGGKPMSLPLTERLSEALNALDRNNGCPYILSFLCRNGPEKGKWVPYKKNSIQSAMQRWTAEAEMGSGWVTHGLRSTFAVYLARQKVDVISIMHALGHSDLATTQIYLQGLNIETSMLELGDTIDAAEARAEHFKKGIKPRLVSNG